MMQSFVVATLIGFTVSLSASCATPELDRPGDSSVLPVFGETEQHADGCGAFRYRGTANVECNYRGKSSLASALPIGTCLNDSQISCDFRSRCDWTVSAVTACTDAAYMVCANLPAEASLLDPPPSVFNLWPGDTLCDPPGRDYDRSSFCENRRSAAESAAGAFCTEQTSRNTGSTTCCLDCKKPTPLPGGLLVPASATSEMEVACEIVAE